MPTVPRDALRKSHVGIKLNDSSSKMEKRLRAAVDEVIETVEQEYGLTAEYEPRLYVEPLVRELNKLYETHLPTALAQAYQGDSKTFMSPDGGFLWIKEWGEDPRRYVLVAEAKRQGTNDVRKLEGKAKQSAGNAIERLGKNMRGIDALFLGETITPFACFGEGCDFAPDCSIIDRVATLNGFFPLRRIFVSKVPIEGDTLKPVSLFFREEPWTPAEMYDVLIQVARQAIDHYIDEYGLPYTKAN
jgi:type II restriction enzyme